MSMTTPRDLFIHELSDAMSAEQQILKMLPTLQEESRRPAIKQALHQHEQETQQQVKNIQTVFQQLGEKPAATTCFAVKGIDEEHKAIRKEKPLPEVLEMAMVRRVELLARDLGQQTMGTPAGRAMA